MLAEIKQLLELQAIDERLADANARISRLEGDLKRLHAAIDDEKDHEANAQEALRQIQHESRMKNLEVDDLDMQIRGYQKRLDEGIISFKEMEDLRAKITSERTRIDQLEDEALSLMDSIEASTRDADAAKARLSEREVKLRGQIEKTETQIAETKTLLEEITANRAKTVDAAPSYLVSQYESLHARFPNPVAEIRNGTCTGCKLRVSGNTAERARGELGVVTCEHCSRVLYTP